MAIYLYASFSRSRARMSSLVSCLYERGGNGIGENLLLSSQWTVVVYTATASSAVMYGPSYKPGQRLAQIGHI